MDKTLEKDEELRATEVHRFIDCEEVRNEYPYTDDSQVSLPEASVVWRSRPFSSFLHYIIDHHLCAVMQKFLHYSTLTLTRQVGYARLKLQWVVRSLA